MKKYLLLTCLFLVVILTTSAQKKFYLGIETGAFFGNANSSIETGMRASGWDDVYNVSFFGWFELYRTYPRKSIDKSQYRVRAGRELSDKSAVEGGFGLSYSGTVKGYNTGSSSAFISIQSKIHTAYLAYVMHDSSRKIGCGIGPALSFYKVHAYDDAQFRKTGTYLLPGVMITAYWNFLSKGPWFLGIRTEMSLTAPAKIDEMNFAGTGRSGSTKFKSVNAGSFNGSVSLGGGVRF